MGAVTSAAIANDGIRDESSQAVLRIIMIGVIEARNFLANVVLRVYRLTTQFGLGVINRWDKRTYFGPLPNCFDFFRVV